MPVLMRLTTKRFPGNAERATRVPDGDSKDRAD